MPRPLAELKSYQREVLARLAFYLRAAERDGGKHAFVEQTDRPYKTAPGLDSALPYVCLRVPTGGGKTLIAAHAVGTAARDFLHTHAPMVLWLVPSNAILEQTLNALKNREHPYRAALAESFGENVAVMDLPEALTMTRADAEGGAVIIVATLAAFRVEDKEGRKVYEQNGNLEAHFSGLGGSQIVGLDRYESGNAIPSLANLLRLHRPMVIVDEAHNARTALTFETLGRLSPSLILELTATPVMEGEGASNVLMQVSAVELKAAQMIKLPIRLRTREDWRLVVGDALDCFRKLEDCAAEEKRRTQEYLRPIMLLQAELRRQNNPDRVTVELLKQHLVESGIPADHIAIATGDQRGIEGVDIAAKDCPLRFIITVQALKEGWDCPFAYVLCSVAKTESSRAVEQILGRILRMPNVRRKTQDELNEAYAFATAQFDEAARAIEAGLVENGFERIEAEQMVVAAPDFAFDESGADFVHESSQLPEDVPPPAFDRLPVELRERVQFDPQRRVIKARGRLSSEDRALLLLAAHANEAAQRAIDRLYRRSNFQPEAPPDREIKPPFVVPRLGMWRQGRLEPFTQDHFLAHPWDLNSEPVGGILQRFQLPTISGQQGAIDISEEGKICWSIAELHEQLTLAIKEPAFDFPRLVNWTDRGISHPDVIAANAKAFMAKAIKNLMAQQGHLLDILVRYRHRLRLALDDEIAHLRKHRAERLFQSCLDLRGGEAKFETSPDIAHVFDEQFYVPRNPYRGPKQWQKHYFEEVGDLRPQGEEFQCASYLDAHPKVRYWIRNVDRQPGSFWLQLPQHRFYPDFICILADGRYLAVEYKGGPFYEQDKELIGKLWANESKGQCVFAMPRDRNLSTIDQAIAA